MAEGSIGTEFGRAKKPPKPQSTHSRRKVVKYTAIGAAGIATGELLKAFAQKNNNKSSSTTSTQSDKIIENAPEISSITPKTETAETESPLLKEGNHILSLPLFSKERNEAETKFAERNKHNIESIDFALSVIHNGENNRLMLLNERFAHFQKGEGGRQPLSKEKLEWAKSWGIGPNNLAMSHEAYPQAYDVVKYMMSLLRPEMPLDTDPRLVMLTPGGMAALFHRETRGLIEIGTKQALSQINTGPKAFPSAKKDLITLCVILYEDSKRRYIADNIPGSERVWTGIPEIDEKASGGAIGAQFMPNRALEFYELARAYDKILNIFDPIDSYVLSHLFITRKEKTELGPRFGLTHGNKAQSKASFEKWNPEPEEMNFIFKADEDYKMHFAPDLPQSI